MDAGAGAAVDVSSAGSSAAFAVARAASFASAAAIERARGDCEAAMICACCLMSTRPEAVDGR